jgi:hypothetical protein
MKPRTYIEYVLNETNKFNLQSSIFNKIYEKEKVKANKRILRSLSFDDNGLVKPSCGTIALYGPFFFFF